VLPQIGFVLQNTVASDFEFRASGFPPKAGPLRSFFQTALTAEHAETAESKPSTFDIPCSTLDIQIFFWGYSDVFLVHPVNA